MRPILVDEIHELALTNELDPVVLNAHEIASPESTAQSLAIGAQINLDPLDNDEQVGIDAQQAVPKALGGVVPIVVVEILPLERSPERAILEIGLHVQCSTSGHMWLVAQ